MADVLRFDIAKDPKGNPITYGRVGDTDGLTRSVKVFEDGKPLDLTGYVITFEGNTSKYRTKVFDTGGVELVDATKGEFTYTFPNMAFAVEGQYERAYFSFAKSDTRKTTGDFEIIVFGNSDIDADEAETIITEYNRLVAELHALQEQAIDDMNGKFDEVENDIIHLENQLMIVQNEINQSLEEFKSGNFWTKEESFNKEESSANMKNLLDSRNFVNGWKMANGSFSQNYPGENLLLGSIPEIEIVGTGTTNQLPGNRYLFFNSAGLERPTLADLGIKVGDKLTFSAEYEISGTGFAGEFSFRLGSASWVLVSPDSARIQITKAGTFNVFQSINVTEAMLGNTYLDERLDNVPSTITIRIRKRKLEIGENSNPVYTPTPTEDYTNSFPRFKGQRLATSNDPDDYDWQYTDEYIEHLSATNYSPDLATQSEAEAGTDSSKLITPSTMNYFYLAKTQKRRQRWDEGLNWVAHRGNNTTYPENTIPAFLATKRHFGIETDIQVTSDGKWVVMHDATVDRTTNGTGAIASMTLAQFRALRIDTGSNLAVCTDAELTPPTLEEYLIACKTVNKVPVIEIKSYAYTDAHYTLLKDTLTRFGYDESNCVVISFDYAVLTKMRALYPNMELQYLVNSITSENINQAITLGVPGAISCSYSNASVTEANIKLIHAAGLKVAVWTVPDASFDKMIKLGVDYITTNSKSGNLRYGKLTFANGFTSNPDGGRVDSNYVEEINGTNLRVEFNVSDGVSAQNSAIATFPDWAIPMYRQFAQCGIRTSGGVSIATFDINGRLVPSAGTPGTIAVGLNWADRTTWAAGSTTYKLD